MGTSAAIIASILNQHTNLLAFHCSHPLATWLCDPQLQNTSTDGDLIEDRYTLNNKICLEVWITSRLPCHSANGTDAWIRFTWPSSASCMTPDYSNLNASGDSSI